MMREGASIQNSQMGGWSQEEIQRGLAHATPIVAAMSKVAPVLKASQALSHYQGGRQRHVARDPAELEQEEDDIRLDEIRPKRYAKARFGKGPGYIVSMTGTKWGWDDAGTGRTVDSPVHRKTTDPFDDMPELHTRAGRKYVSKTKFNPKKSGSQ